MTEVSYVNSQKKPPDMVDLPNMVIIVMMDPRLRGDDNSSYCMQPVGKKMS